MTQRDTSSDNSAAFLGGQQAFWAGGTYEAAAGTSEWHGRGWVAAAAEARRTLAEHADVLRHAGEIRDALSGCIAAIRNLAPVKIRPAQRKIRDDALIAANTAWAYFKLPRPEQERSAGHD